MTSNGTGADQNNQEFKFSQEPFYCMHGRWAHQPYYYYPHWHDFIELLFLRKGYLKGTVRNKELIINEGELLVVMPGELHTFVNEGDTIMENFVIHIDSVFLHNAVFDSKELSQIYPYLFSSWAPRFFLCSADEMKKSGMLHIITDIYMEYMKKDPGYNISIRGDLLKVFVWFLRRWNLYSHQIPEPDNLTIYMRMQPVLDLIKEQYNKKITTNEMADRMHMSVYHFCRLFKKLTGYSFHNYLRSRRIDEAIKLLLSGDDSVKQIASKAGYDNENFFIRVFKNEIGMPPDKYRKKYRQAPSQQVS
ncbi:MAG: AraC family transcriptional regulator [Treponema sp.]|nr:AraC family transcriptional regulator [Treponema sp.]